jgi:hypothetical protein
LGLESGGVGALPVERVLGVDRQSWVKPVKQGGTTRGVSGQATRLASKSIRLSASDVRSERATEATPRGGVLDHGCSWCSRYQARHHLGSEMPLAAIRRQL